MPSLEIDSGHPARGARQIVRENLASREPILSTPTDRYVLGFVRDPAFELIAVGPASEGGMGPLRWRSPSRSRPLRGTIGEGDQGTAHLVATFAGTTLFRTRASRRTEAWLLGWVRELLDTQGVTADGPAA